MDEAADGDDGRRGEVEEAPLFSLLRYPEIPFLSPLAVERIIIFSEAELPIRQGGAAAHTYRRWRAPSTPLFFLPSPSGISFF